MQIRTRLFLQANNVRHVAYVSARHWLMKSLPLTEVNARPKLYTIAAIIAGR